MIQPVTIHLNINSDYSTINLMANLIIIGYFSVQTIKLCLHRYHLDLKELPKIISYGTNFIVTKIVNEFQNYDQETTAQKTD